MTSNTETRPPEFVATFIEPPTWARPSDPDPEEHPNPRHHS